VLDVVANVLARQKKPFLDDEEERLAMIVLRVSQNLNQATGSINRFFNETDIIRWTDYTEHSHNNEAYYRVSSWKRLMMMLYFMAPSMQSTLLPLVTKYFQKMGYLDWVMGLSRPRRNLPAHHRYPSCHMTDCHYY
jgi:hypothetical protein